MARTLQVVGKIAEIIDHILQDAWRYGLVSAADGDWSEQIGALKDYQERHGHVHVGFDFSTDIELTKFAKMQRAAFKSGTLQPQRQVFVFIFDKLADSTDFSKV